jgi:uncharacterized membrane protein
LTPTRSVPGFRRRGAVSALVIGAAMMTLGALLGAVLYQSGVEALSLIVGGAGFLFGAMWFGSGIRQLRGKRDIPDRG